MIDPATLEAGDEVTSLKEKGDSPNYEVLRIEERRSLDGVETVVVVAENELDERDLWERHYEHYEEV